MSLSGSFASCQFSPVTKEPTSGDDTMILPSPIGTWKTTSFFLDSSGRSSFALPLMLTFPSQDLLNVCLAANCLKPPPHNLVVPNNNDPNADSDNSSPPESSIGFEVKSYPVDEMKRVAVEGVTILSCSVEGLSVYFNTNVTVRASVSPGAGPLPGNTPDKKMSGGDASRKSALEHPSELSVDANLEITPVLSIKRIFNPKNSSQASRESSNDEDPDKAKNDNDIPDLMALELGAIPDHMQKESISRVQETRLASIGLDVRLTHAFTIAVTGTSGPNLGSTMISLTIAHSGTHSELVTITNIAIHPGHSRPYKSHNQEQRKSGKQHAVINMTKAVQWRYAPQTELDLPLTLNPREAYSTIICVDAGEEMRSGSFFSPVSVTGVVGRADEEDDNGGGNKGSPQSEFTNRRHQRIVVAADASWRTGLVAVEPADAFRMEMNVTQAESTVGEPMTLSIRIFNLSMESRDLMLLMAKEDNSSAGTTVSPKDEAVNTAVVSEVNGYTFGIWGISGQDNGTSRYNRDHELLAVDAALLLGVVMGQHAVDAQLRFVPLVEGTLKVPNWKLYDKSSGRWYNCIHNLKIVATRPATVV